MSENSDLNTDQLKKTRNRLHDDLFLHTGSMFRYCCNMGILLPESMLQRFNDIMQKWIDRNDQGEGEQSMSMGSDLEDLTKIYNALAEKIAPAVPGAVLMIDKGMAPVSFWRYVLGFRLLGPIGIVRALMAVAMVFLMVFLGMSLSPYVNAENMGKTVLELNGLALACNLLFLLSAAALGAAFAALFDLKTYITKRTYDHVYDTDYWIKFFLGIISGVMLSELIPIEDLAGGDSSRLSRPLLAMLGGFSVKAFYQILKRIVSTLETLVQGKPK